MKTLFASISLFVLMMTGTPAWAQTGDTLIAPAPVAVAPDTTANAGQEAATPANAGHGSTAQATPTVTAEPAEKMPASEVLPAALRVSGISLVVIFVVMGGFGGLITLLGRLLPASDED